MPSPSPPPDVRAILQGRRAVLVRKRVVQPRTLELSGTRIGLNLYGTFHSWHDGDEDRYDQVLGVRLERIVRIGNREYIVNSTGNVRQLTGWLAQRQVTEDFINSDAFENQPQYSTALGRAQLDGRNVVQLRVAPPGGAVETVSLDAATLMIDRISFVDGDGLETDDFRDYRVVDRALIPFTEIDSDGEHRYDSAQRVVAVRVNKPISAKVFATPQNSTIRTNSPVTVPLEFHDGHYYAAVSIHGKTLRFLIDTGAQGVVIDSRAASQLTLVPQGLLEVRGARRVSAVGVAALDSVSIGGADLPLGEVSIIDLNPATPNDPAIDGVLGYPFFASAEVRLDFGALTMTFGKPGSLPTLGERLDVDTDRESAEVPVKIDGVPATCFVDTGNSNELLIFNPFVQTHPGLIAYAGTSPVSSYGVGGSMSAIAVTVNELDLGSYQLFNRSADVMQVDTGAFADRIDAGNIGLGVLRNFVATFDLANRAMYLQPSPAFDDGRTRPTAPPQGSQRSPGSPRSFQETWR